MKDPQDVYCGATVGELQPGSYIACGEYLGYRDEPGILFDVQTVEGPVRTMGLCPTHREIYRREGWLTEQGEEVKGMVERLIEVDWNPTNRQYTVYSRASAEHDWTVTVCVEGEFGNVINLAHDVVTGG